jgi:hypothetical protein
VIWLFDREGEQIKYEIRRDENSGGYLLVITSSAGQERIERIEEPTELIERSIDEMQRLKDDGWKVG